MMATDNLGVRRLLASGAAALLGLLGTAVGPLAAAEPEAKAPLVFADDFEQGADHWQPTDPKAWKIGEGAQGNRFYSQFQQSKYKPPHRSPFNFSLVKDAVVGDFVLETRVRSTVKDYPHRDVCLVFGYQDPGHFYYVHLGKRTDDHANQIFIVNDAPRTKISTKTTPGTDWDDEWHAVKIVRRTADGDIEIYYDDMVNPIMTAQDKSFVWGQVGLGSFDDTGDWDDVKLYGRRESRQKKE
jgi:hypothetical protein